MEDRHCDSCKYSVFLYTGHDKLPDGIRGVCTYAPDGVPRTCYWNWRACANWRGF